MKTNYFTAIITLVEKVSNALRQWKNCCRCILDLKRTFDRVDHTILLRKLQSYGIRGNVHAWLYSYLNYKSQYVHFNYNNSDRKHITDGVTKYLYWGLCCSLFT